LAFKLLTPVNHPEEESIIRIIDTLHEVHQWQEQAVSWPHMPYTKYIIPFPVYVCKALHVQWYQNYTNEQRNEETLCIPVQTKSSQSHYHTQNLRYLSFNTLPSGHV
jgi:hypothetical protein